MLPSLTPRTLLTLALLGAAGLPLGCAQPPAGEKATTPEPAQTAKAANDMRPDPHSFARPAEARVEHLSLDLTADFTAKKLHGRASLRIASAPGASELHLDTRDLTIEKVTLDDGAETTFTLGEADPVLGRELTIAITPTTQVVHVDYATSPQAAALQWLEPRQTAGGKQPFLFTQSQAILARTWVPCQDTPGVRMTYDATVHVPTELLAVMSAENTPEKNSEGVYRFKLEQPIPSYLLALAVGDLAFRSIGDRTGVYAEPSVVEKAAWEFADTETMVEKVEALYGPYRWGRYDLLVLPPSFPFGGMENPRLTFATPTIIAGDRSLVALVAHELAHSWSGNLVTNATWNDFWLNEGFTVYLERRIMEALEGQEYADMLTVLSLQEVRGTIEELGAQSPDTHLRLALAGRDPDEGMNDIAYDKGYFFLRRIEETVGRERFDPFLRKWFDDNAFHSRTTDDFLTALRTQLLADDPGLEQQIGIAAWVDGPGLPDNLPVVSSKAFEQVDAELARFDAGTPAAQLETEGWTTHHWLHFLRGLKPDLGNDKLADLDAAFGFTKSGNAEILVAWFEQAIRNRYTPANEALEAFLTQVGRRKFLKPLYEKLAATPEGLEQAKAIYAKARPGYHSVAVGTIDKILKWEEG